MNRTFAALALTVLTLAPAAASAAAQSGGRSEAERKLAFVRSVTGDRSWRCSMVPMTNPGPVMTVDMNVTLLSDGRASATTTSAASLNGRVYSATYRLVGQVRALANGQATFDLGQSRMVRADPLPRGQAWSDSSSVRLSFAVVPDTVSDGLYPFMLQGFQSDNVGRSAITCMVQTR